MNFNTVKTLYNQIRTKFTRKNIPLFLGVFFIFIAVILITIVIVNKNTVSDSQVNNDTNLGNSITPTTDLAYTLPEEISPALDPTLSLSPSISTTISAIPLSLTPGLTNVTTSNPVKSTVKPTNTSIPATSTPKPAVPATGSNWPFKTTFQIGSSDSAGEASDLKSAIPGIGFRYHYLAGGVNTGSGWATWNTNGDFARYFIEDSINNGIVPVFSYYQIRQSSPGKDMNEFDGVIANTKNNSTMKAYFEDLKLFFQKAGAFGSKSVVLHVEPDLWGFLEQKYGDNASSVQMSVASSGMADVSGLANNASGFAQAIVKLRDKYASNVSLGFHLSDWGTGTSIIANKPSSSSIDSLAAKASNFYKSLNANFDIIFTDQNDRDAEFKRANYGDNGATWFQESDYNNYARFYSKFSSSTGKKIVIWQIPLGNTKMKAVNNTWGHYQDNHVEWFLDDSTATHIQNYINSGVVALMYGAGADGATCACDGQGDGVTNPSPINGNTLNSYNSDDDGGYFKSKAKIYYTAGAKRISF